MLWGVGAFTHGVLHVLRKHGAEVCTYLTRDYAHYSPSLEGETFHNEIYPNPCPIIWSPPILFLLNDPPLVSFSLVQHSQRRRQDDTVNAITRVALGEHLSLAHHRLFFSVRRSDEKRPQSPTHKSFEYWLLLPPLKPVRVLLSHPLPLTRFYCAWRVSLRDLLRCLLCRWNHVRCSRVTRAFGAVWFFVPWPNFNLHLASCDPVVEAVRLSAAWAVVDFHDLV